jgi:hypothetical protein
MDCFVTSLLAMTALVTASAALQSAPIHRHCERSAADPVFCNIIHRLLHCVRNDILRHRERSLAIQSLKHRIDCVVTSLLAMTALVTASVAWQSAPPPSLRAQRGSLYQGSFSPSLDCFTAFAMTSFVIASVAWQSSL